MSAGGMVVAPWLALFAGAALLPLAPARWRALVVLGAPAAALWLVWQVPDGVAASVHFLDYELAPVEGDRLRRLFGTVFSIMGIAGGVYALGQARTVELVAALVYAGASLGVVFAGDLVTLFVFWEVMALASTGVLWASGTDGAWRASRRYLLVHLFGGVVLMIGIAGWVAATGQVSFGPMTAALDGGPGMAGAWLILAGFALNAGAPPLSAWLPDAYPEASPTGMVFLSAFTTKTAVCVLIQGFPGAGILIWVGLYMIFYGIVYALLENDMRRILAYSIVNQVGFMVCGIGIGGELALNGAAAHAFTHIVYKALLLMSAGAVLLQTGRRKCTDLGGLFQTMPLTAACGIVGALAISSFPLTSGFISKSMISQSAAEGHLTLVWLGLAAASAGVFLHAGIKFPWFVFFQRDSGLRPSEPPWNMRLAMVAFAAVCIGLGIWPGPLYDILPYPVDYVPYTGEHVVAQAQLLLFSGLAFFVMLPAMRRTLTISLDFDWFYRRAPVLLWRIVGPAASGALALGGAGVRAALAAAGVAIGRSYGPRGGVSAPWTTERMALWAVVLLGCVIVFYYV